MSPAQKDSLATLSLTGFLAVVLVCILWGGSIPIIKVSEHGLPPLFMATGRIAVATPLLFVYTRIIHEPVMLPRSYGWHGVALGLLLGLTLVFLYLGFVFTNAARGIIFYSTKPFWVAIGAHLLVSEERLTVCKLFGLALALLGMYLTFWGPGAAGPNMEWGNLMELGAALCFSVIALYTKWLSNQEKLNHFQILFSTMLFSIPILLISSLIFEWGYPIVFSWSDLLAFGYQSLGAQFLAYILWFWLIYRFPVCQVASFTFLVPLVGVILSAIFLREPVPPILWLGLALVSAGIVLVNWPKRGHQA